MIIEFGDKRCKVEDKFMDEVSNLVGHSDAAAMVRDALGIYKWYLQEKKQERIVISCWPDGREIKKLEL